MPAPSTFAPSRLERLLDAIARTPAPVERIRLLARAATLQAQAGRLDDARRSADQAERRMAAARLTVLHPDVLYAKAAIRLAAGHDDEAVATLVGAAELARESGRRDFLAPCDALLGLACVKSGLVDRGIMYADRALAAVDSVDHETLFHVWTAFARALVADEQFDAAQTAFAHARTAALALRDDVALADVLHGIVEGQTAMFEAHDRSGRLAPGEAEAALVDSESAARLGERAGMVHSRARARLQRARLLLLLRRPLEAEAVLRDLLDRQIDNLDRAEVNWARALLARCIAERGGRVQARALLEFALAGVEDRPGEAPVATYRVAAEVHRLLADGAGCKAAAAAAMRLQTRLHHGLADSRATLARVLEREATFRPSTRS